MDLLFVSHGGSSGKIPTPTTSPGFFGMIDLAEALLDDIRALSNFLFYTPSTFKVYNPIGLIVQLVMNSGSDFGEALSVLVDIFGINTYIEVPNIFGSIGGMIIGGGLIFVVGFRLVKFFTDIVL